MTRWRFNWCTDWDEVWDGTCLEQWRKLLVRSSHATAYHLPELVRYWSETCGRETGATAMIGLAENGDGDRVLIPAAITKTTGRYTKRRVLEYAGGAMFGYHDPLALCRSRDGIDWTSFWMAVRKETRISCDLGLIRFIHANCAGASLPQRRTENNPVLELAGINSLEEVLANCSGNHRGDVRRRLRRLRERGDLRLWCAAPSEAAEASRDFETAFAPAYEQQSRVDSERYLFRFPGVREFCDRVIENGVRDGWAHYCALQLNGESIAWHLGLLHDQQLYWWIPTYRRDWQRFSPGKALLALLIEHGLRSRWNRIHFLTGGHGYKLAWRPNSVFLQTIRWHAPTYKGRILRLYDSLRGDRHRIHKAPCP